MSNWPITVVRQPAARLARFVDYVELTKPRISVLVLTTVAASAYVARWGRLDIWSLFATLLGTLLVAASASALNQLLERHRDARMARTAQRPLPCGRLGIAEAVVFAAATVVAGTSVLVAAGGWVTAVWGLLTWIIYVWIYTPLKSQTVLNTTVGAVAGALPVFIGWSSTGAAIDLRLLCLFTIVYLWQFPHFMAIAWIYREQYRRSGMMMLSVFDPTGRRAGVQAVVSALALLPVSLVPGLVSPGASLYLVAVFVLGIGQLLCAAWFLIRRDQLAARWLLKASLVYLPALLVFLMLIPLI